ncbi:MAG: hypothetical protein JNM21_12605 [Taibaiella sp.]|nr:hypothetical protein [Taibaiella sp.]
MSRVSNSRMRRKHINASEIREDAVLIESAKVASSKALRSSKAMGITIKIIKDRKIIEVSPDNTTSVIRTISKSKIDTSSFKKGMVLVRK